MGFYNDIKTKATQLQGSLATELIKFRNRDLMDAILAGCALVATADGTVSAEEKEKMLGFVRNSDALKHYDTSLVIDTFQKYIGKLEFDFALGRAELLQEISKVSKKMDEARLLVRVCCAIGTSDGDFGQQEKQVVHDICLEVGLNPTDFDL
ncbi:MAG: tellurite resistance TerB family protein [Magnetococcales bacterium]|nr:tellurite resistance TerB family protein [Magnetococcales bacterium]